MSLIKDTNSLEDIETSYEKNEILLLKMNLV